VPLPLRPHAVQWLRLQEVLTGTRVVGHERVVVGSFSGHLDRQGAKASAEPGQILTQQRAVLRGEIGDLAPIKSGDWIQHGDQLWLVVSEPVIHDAEPTLAHAEVEVQSA